MSTSSTAPGSRPGCGNGVTNARASWSTLVTSKMAFDHTPPLHGFEYFRPRRNFSTLLTTETRVRPLAGGGELVIPSRTEEVETHRRMPDRIRSRDGGRRLSGVEILVLGGVTPRKLPNPRGPGSDQDQEWMCPRRVRVTPTRHTM